jgi:hypothetical protein
MIIINSQKTNVNKLQSSISNKPMLIDETEKKSIKKGLKLIQQTRDSGHETEIIQYKAN